jgi:ATP-binding cassette subfamily B protein/subfamily B ATP-binding cassette protein MsbA
LRTFFRIFRYTGRYPWRAATTFLLAVLGTLLVLVLPAVTQAFVDEVIPQRQDDRILPLVGLAVGAIALRQFVTMLRNWCNSSFEQCIVHDLRLELYQKIQRLPLRFFDKQPTGDIMNRVAADVPAMERVILGVLDQGLSGLLQFSIVFGYLLYLHPWLAVLSVAPLPLVALSTKLYHSYAESRYRTASEAASSLNSLVHDNVAGIRQIKAYTVEPEELQRFEAKSADVKDAQMKVIKANSVIWPLVSLIAESGIIITLAFGTLWIIQGTTTLGVLSAVLMSWGLLYDPISRINPLTQLFTSGVVAGKRVFSILDLMAEQNLIQGERPESLRGEICYEGVTFSYDKKSESPTVSDVNVRAGAGETIAFVGPTGAGKSTLLNLITRFYELDRGVITLDGKPITELSKEWLRDRIGYVTQDSFLFNSSIRENLSLAKVDATEEEMWEVLSAANAAVFVKEMKEGLDSVAGERGTRLSGGERQRLSIARALLKNPPILLLDEATSAVDNETEQLIQEALDRLRANRTCFVIAHRLTTVREADRIYVMKDGRVVEVGKHEELLAQAGLYAKLCSGSQADQALVGVIQ